MKGTTQGQSFSEREQYNQRLCKNCNRVFTPDKECPQQEYCSNDCWVKYHKGVNFGNSK